VVFFAGWCSRQSYVLLEEDHSMRKSVLFTAVSTVVALCLQAACGSDGETTCTTGAGNNGGSGGQGGGTPGTMAFAWPRS
jgi:hypothetical protein